MRNTEPDQSSLRHADGELHCHICGGSQFCQKFAVPLLDGPQKHYRDLQHKLIYRCETCGHLWAGLYDPSGFADYYGSLSADCHTKIHDADRFRYLRVREVVTQQPVKRLLDIGCGTGTFLAMLPSGIERFGIEPTRAAAEVARARGIQIVQSEDLARPELRNSFDVVTAIDVLEHATDLMEFRRQITSALRPGGVAILLTGDAASTSARLLGRYWYYLNGAEHVTFFCPRSMRTWLQQDFHPIDLTKTDHNHLHLGWSAAIRSFLAFPVKLALRRLWPNVWKNKYVILYLPGDHMLVKAVRNQTLSPSDTDVIAQS